MTAIEIKKLSKRYRDITAVDRLSLEIGAGELSPVKEGQGQPVAERRPQLFYQIQSKGWAARTQGMEIAGGGIQSHRFQRRSDVVRQLSIQEG